MQGQETRFIRGTKVRYRKIVGKDCKCVCQLAYICGEKIPVFCYLDVSNILKLICDPLCLRELQACQTKIKLNMWGNTQYV